MDIYCLTNVHRRSHCSIFSGGALFLTKTLITFFYSSPSFRWSYASYIATTYLFMSSAGVHIPNFSPIFPHFNKKCLEIFFCHPGGVHLHPLHPLATPMLSPSSSSSSSSSSSVHRREIKIRFHTFKHAVRVKLFADFIFWANSHAAFVALSLKCALRIFSVYLLEERDEKVTVNGSVCPQNFR